MQEIAFGQIRMSRNEFFEMTPREFFNALKGFRKLQETESRERHVLARFTAWASLKPYAKKQFKETDLIQFPWETEVIEFTHARDAEQVEKEYQEVADYWLEIDRRRNKHKTDC